MEVISSDSFARYEQRTFQAKHGSCDDFSSSARFLFSPPGKDQPKPATATKTAERRQYSAARIKTAMDRAMAKFKSKRAARATGARDAVARATDKLRSTFDPGSREKD